MFEQLSIPKIFDKDAPALMRPFKEELAEISVKAGREYLAAFSSHLCTLFAEGFTVKSLLYLRSDFTDALLKRIYEHFGLHKFPYLALIAVGGYGRRELFLQSDIDILVLSSVDPLPPDAKDAIEPFISFLWDLKLDIGSSVRTIKETVLESRQDLTIETNLLERRLIAGSYLTLNLLKDALDGDTYWDPKRFLRAKIHEQIERHHLYKDTAYLLEPDIKNNPGGLRDIQVMQWIANFHFKARTLHDMLNLGLLLPNEFEELTLCRKVLWAVRYALHITIKREDNRLTLDSQKNVAALLGFGTEGNAPVERLMRVFFRTVRRIRELNSMTLQLETLRITGHLGDDRPLYIDSCFIKRGPLIDIADPDIFKNEPWRMLQLFTVIAHQDDVLGLHVNCLRQLRAARRALNIYLIEIPRCREIFKQILSDQSCLATALPLLHEHRMLSAYMPQWESIEGLSQFDMFHTYTVDEHIIRVLKNIAVFSCSKEPAHALFRTLFQQLPDPEILIAAAFLHDIAKGQGGHHAELGAKQALYFCQLHGYTQYQSRLIAWLVAEHLVFSATALRRDIADPEVIKNFAALMQDEEHLDLLYCLTAADIAATNDHEWTSWKDSIFRKLYFAVRQALRQGLERPQDLALHVKENQQLALKLCRRVSEEQARRWWAQMPETYFIQYTPLDIAWHTRNILQHQRSSEPLILFAQHQELGTELFIYQKTGRFEFARAACVMAQKRLNVITAEIVQTADNSALCTIRFHGPTGQAVDNDRLHNLRRSMLDGLKREPSLTGLKLTAFKSPFTIPPQVEFLDSGTERHTSIEISTLDTPGLLAKIGITLKNLGCYILSARVTTTGERADDFFTLVSAAGTALNAAQQLEVKGALLQALAAQADAAAAPRR